MRPHIRLRSAKHDVYILVPTSLCPLIYITRTHAALLHSCQKHLVRVYKYVYIYIGHDIISVIRYSSIIYAEQQ